MAKAIVQVALEREGALAADVVVNTWHFESDHDFDTDTGDLFTRLQAFYEGISAILGSQLSGNARVRMYDYTDSIPRVPKFDDEFTFTPATNSLPAELAVCLSFRAEYVSGSSRARRRGRVYLGPLSLEIVGAVDADAAVHPTYRTLIKNEALDLATGGSGTYRLAVYSPTTKLTGGTDDQAWNDAVELWVDDAFDIQRRRGHAPSTRTTGVIS